MLIRCRFKLPDVRGILPNLVDDQVKNVFEHVKLRRDQVVINASRLSLAIFVGTFGFALDHAGAIELCSGITEPSAVAPCQSHSHGCFGRIDPALPLGSVLVNQQLSFDCSNLRVDHAKAVQLTAATEGDVLYMIGK